MVFHPTTLSGGKTVLTQSEEQRKELRMAVLRACENSCLMELPAARNDVREGKTHHDKVL